ncbi:MAG: tetratricopeptide repeat protein [Calditrichaeota bacterium]|nr:tetratricopeptide repeat protein [Calditrichota bacterium]
MTPQPDSGLLWMFVAALAAIVGVAAYSWWQKQQTRRVIPRDPYTEGLNHLLAGRLREAASAFADAIRANTDHMDAYLKLGSILRQMGKPRRAAQIHLELSVRADQPPHVLAAIYRELACDHEQAGNLDRAHRYLDRSRSLDPGTPDDLIIRLRLLEHQNRWRDAAESLKKLNSVTGRPDDRRMALYLLQEGEALCAAGKEHDGRVAFKDAMRVDPQAPTGMLHIAASYTRESRGDDAFEWLSKFMREQPDQAHLALSLLEPLLYDLGRFGEVESILKKSFEQAPANRALAVALIDLKSKKGEVDDALDLCDRALESNPDDATLLLLKTQLLRRRGADDEAGRHLDRMVQALIAKSLSLYCRSCGAEAERILPRCPACGEWHTFYGDRRK